MTGVVAQTADGELRVDATFTVAADGRSSTVRDRLRLTAEETGVPIDVLWLRLPRPTVPLPDTLAYIGASTMVVTIPRPDYLQCGVLIPKGTSRASGPTGCRRSASGSSGPRHHSRRWSTS